MIDKKEYIRELMTSMAINQPNKELLIPLYEKQGDILFEISEHVSTIIFNGDVYFGVLNLLQYLNFDNDAILNYYDECKEKAEDYLEVQNDIIELQYFNGNSVILVNEIEMLNSIFPNCKLPLAAEYMELWEQTDALHVDLELGE